MSEEKQTKEAPEAKEETKATPEMKEETKAVAVPAKFKNIVEAIEKMSVLDLHELVKLFEEKFGVSASAVAAAPAAEAEGDTGGGLVDLTLEDGGATKIQVIKVVKEVLGLGLKEAKDFVDGAPKVLKKGISPEEAEELKGNLEGAGAKVTVA